MTEEKTPLQPANTLRWYFACSLVMYTHPKYDELLSHVQTNLEVISPGTVNEIIQAKGRYGSAQEWLGKWPHIYQNVINGGLFFVLDNAGYIGKGVFTEIGDVLKKGLPVFLMERDGSRHPLSTLEQDAISLGPNWTLYAHVDINRLKASFDKER